MNTERLKQLVENLIKDEKQYKIQQHLANLNAALQNYSNNPITSNQLVEFSNRLKELQNHLKKLITKYDSPQISQFKEIGAIEYFSPELTTKIKSLVNENPMTPAVVHAEVQKIISQRNQYFSNLKNLVSCLNALGFETDYLEEGDQEIGFQLPRNIFYNNLDGLIDELRVIRRMVRAFAEAAHGTVEPIEVRSISTSDPIFFFGLTVETIVHIGGAITWALATWQQVEHIRKSRAETAKTKVFTEEELSSFFDKKIKDEIQKAINEKAEALISSDTDEHRRKEQVTNMKRALDALLARIERGMTVEIKFLPLPEEETEVPGGEEAPEPSNKTKLYRELENITPNLSFPEVEDAPILKLERLQNGDSQEGE